MMKKIFLLFFVFYFLALIQASFLPHFIIYGTTLNLIAFAVILINFIEKPEGKLGFFSAFWGGFLLDAFSGNFIGLYVLIFLAITFFLKIIFPKYMRISFLQNC